MNIVDSYEMSSFDKETINNGTSSITLMKRASLKMLENIDKSIKTCIITGSGNNGGDGFSLAEELYKINRNITVVKVLEPKTDEAKYYEKRIINQGVNVIKYTDLKCLDGYDQYIDCIFGIGLNKDIKGPIIDIINYINSLNKIIICCDISSGLNANNGCTTLAFNATKTITFGAAKLGHVLSKGKDYTGELVVCDIGIDCSKSKCKIYQKEDFKYHFLPLKQDLHKYTNGKVVIIGGSKNYVGAPILANSSLNSLRVGAGLSTIAFPDILYDAVSCRVLNSTMFPLSSNEEGFVFIREEFDKLLIKTKAVAIGMGIGISDEVKLALKYLLKQDINLLIDADALTVLSKDLSILTGKTARVILTPHIGEFSRLTNLKSDEILDNPIEIAKDFASKYNVTLLLKGTSSIITDGNKIAISNYGNSSLSKGGSGDTLSGIILGLLTKMDTFDAAVIGSYILGRSSTLLQEEKTCYSVIPSDIPDVIPKVIKEIIN